MDKIKVYEVNDGQWTHSLAADGEHWSKGETIRRATNLAKLNGMELFVDFPLESQRRATELGIDLYAPVKRGNNIDEWVSPKPERFDPFA